MCKVIYIFGDDVSTDVIYPGRYMATMLPNETPQYAFADIPDFNTNIQLTEVIVAGENFGCGSSREQAVSTLVGNKVIVIAKSFARIFKQNAVNLGLNIIICPDLVLEEFNIDDKVEISPRLVRNKTTGKRFKIDPLPPSAQEVLDAGGLIQYTRKRLQEKM